MKSYFVEMTANSIDLFYLTLTTYVQILGLSFTQQKHVPLTLFYGAAPLTGDIF